MRFGPSNSATRLGSVALRYRTPLAGAAPRWSVLRLTSGNAQANSASGTLADDQEAKLARVEAALFLSREPLSTRKLGTVAKLADGTEARTVVKLLAQRYDERASAIQVVEVAGGVQLFTSPAVADWVRRLPG